MSLLLILNSKVSEIVNLPPGGIDVPNPVLYCLPSIVFVMGYLVSVLMWYTCTDFYDNHIKTLTYDVKRLMHSLAVSATFTTTLLFVEGKLTPMISAYNSVLLVIMFIMGAIKLGRFLMSYHEVLKDKRGKR